ncbi:hypothetical protein LNKW23_04040 [Paralimibaculum aggregatum]|uniref:Uncharacterized protein n=1 Tax=Paralimibaculum aggregatum TaxID=3036245 RepID=A0ABQ6LE20_9RHOB|nr:hypothetical protein [Limibaculum sp. NKW23]GMG81192.1 hypothetical protein LNKW23_04040 [Limibaculum sp. NKW23]
MARFDPKKHDLSRAEAKFLSALARLSTREAAKEVEQAEKALAECRRKVEKARADVDRRMKAAADDFGKAVKKHGELMKQIGQAEALIARIEAAPPRLANPLAVKLGTLSTGIGSTQARMAALFDCVAVQVGGALTSVRVVNTRTLPGARIVPSQIKTLVLAH